MAGAEGIGEEEEMFGVSVGFQDRVSWTEERVQGRAGRFEGRMARQLGGSAGCQNLCPFLLRSTSSYASALPLLHLSPPFSHPSSAVRSLPFSPVASPLFFFLLFSFNSNRSRCVFLSRFVRIRKGLSSAHPSIQRKTPFRVYTLILT